MTDEASSLYEILEVPRDATVRVIRAAYRSLSKNNHPDAGGDPAKFAELTLARDVLTNPELRKQYDETGLVPQDEAKNAAAAIITRLSQLRQEAWYKVATAGGNPMQCDMVAAMRALAAEKIDGNNQSREKLTIAAAHLKKFAGWWKVPGLDEPNFMQIVDLNHAQTLEIQINNFIGENEVLRAASDYLGSVRFEPVDPVEA